MLGGENTIVIGRQAYAKGDRSIAFGPYAYSKSENWVASVMDLKL